MGLSIGMTCTILILLWVQDEWNYDKSHEHYQSIYQVMAHRSFDNQTGTDYSMVFPLAETIESEISQIEEAVVSAHVNTINVRYQDQVYSLDGRTTSPNFLEVFSAEIIQNSGGNPIKDPNSIVLTASAAKTIFGDQDPLNQVIEISHQGEVKVAAIIEDLPANSSIQFDLLRSFDYSSDYVKRNRDEWSSSSWMVFIKTAPEADMDWVDEQINKIKYRHDPGDRDISTYFSFPMRKWRLYSDFNQGVNTGGMIQYVRMFTTIAIIILIIACVNFMNLSTARSERRAMEVGIRKTFGSHKRQLIFQFFTESLILTLLAFLVAVLTVWLLLPTYNQLVDKELMFNLGTPWMWGAALSIILFTSLVAGSYPAVFLSSFNPVKVLKSTLATGRGAVRPRQLLMIFQFMVSMLLISATVIIYQQITMIKNRDLGYDPDNLISIAGSADTQKNFNVLKQELLNTGMVESLTRTMSPITNIWWHLPGPDWTGKPEGANTIFSGLNIGTDFTRTMGIKMVAGKDFSGSPADSSYVLLNQAAVNEMGLKDPVGTPLHRDGDYTVLGVTENVVQDSPFHPVEPMIIFYNPSNTYYISIRLKQGVHPHQAIPPIEQVFRQYNPSNVFDFDFVDQEFDKKFATEELIQKLSNIFAGLAIFICCLGLAGLAAFTIERRIKEISMRRVLGATIQQLLTLISRDFLQLVLIAFIIAVPVTWWSMNEWLKNYTIRIEISIWMFLVVGLGIFLLALAVVSVNTLKAAMSNPMKSLRSE
ncbi:MAG: ABC transporter substrate-binding protein [Cyclobacteriaceae bacterium]|nr:MAG: ABC transporter substrate-binding protein [Cyclobacteriaceae bacterium]